MRVSRILPNGEKKMLYVDGKLNELLQGFRKAVYEHNTSIVLVIDGKSGMGKTTLANQIGLLLDDKYDLPKLYYEPESFLEGLANSKKGDCLVFDEAMLLSSRTALSKVNLMVIQALSMIRSKNIFLIFCVNSIFDIDKNIAIYRADLLLHVYGETLIDRGRFGAFFKGRDGQDRLKALYLLGKKYYSYGKPKANFLGRFTKEFIVDEQKYEKQKQEGVNRFLRGERSSKKKTKVRTTRDKLIFYIIKQDIMKVKQISEASGLSQGSIYDIVKENEG